MILKRWNKKYIQITVEVVVLVLVILLSTFLNETNRKDIWEYDERDIYWEILSAREISNGGNPYTEILEGDLLTNNKYATLLPLYYQYLAFIDSSTNSNFEQTMDVHRIVIFISQIVGGVFIYLLFRREKKYLVGLLAATFFLFNRWTLFNIMDAKQDLIAISFLIMSLYFLTSKNKKNLYISAFLFGISMGIKHIGIFISPIFLLPVIYRKLNFKETALYAFLFLIPSIIVGLPLIIDSPNGFFYSIMFSFTREPTYKDGEYVYQALVLYEVGVKNNNVIFYMLPRLPLLFFTLLNTALLLFKKIPVSLYCLSGIFIFVALNPTLIEQYFTWITPFIFLTMIDNNLFTRVKE